MNSNPVQVFPVDNSCEVARGSIKTCRKKENHITTADRLEATTHPSTGKYRSSVRDTVDSRDTDTTATSRAKKKEKKEKRREKKEKKVFMRHVCKFYDCPKWKHQSVLWSGKVLLYMLRQDCATVCMKAGQDFPSPIWQFKILHRRVTTAC